MILNELKYIGYLYKFMAATDMSPKMTSQNIREQRNYRRYYHMLMLLPDCQFPGIFQNYLECLRYIQINKKRN